MYGPDGNGMNDHHYNQHKHVYLNQTAMVHVLLTQKRENIYNVYIYIYNIQFLFGHFFHILGIWDIQEH